MLDDHEREAWIALSLVPGIGPTRHRRLREYFGGARGAWCAPEVELCAVEGLAAQTVSALIAARGGDPQAAAAGQAAGVSGGPWRVACLGDAEYPSLLGEVYDPPPVLWLQGQIPPGPRVAIVGSRRATPYGLRVAREFAAALVAAGVTVVSGLARGIDTAAHEGALKGGGRTLAVLGCGLDIAYPPENARLQGTIAEQGAVLSELPPGSAPTAGNFPARNRIISGLCQATLVIEAGERSGALITASQALEQGREVLAVPGNITSLASVGCNRLIVDGARPALSPADVLSALGSANPVESGAPGLDNSGIAAYILPESTATSATTATRILSALDADGMSLTDLCARTGIAAPELLATLTVLQLSGYVGALPGGRFVSFCQQRR